VALRAMSDTAHDPASASDALGIFLEFREADMLLWRRAGSALGLSAMAMLALRAHARGSAVRQVDISEALQLSPAGTSAIVTALEERDLVRREPSATDGRALNIVPGDGSAQIGEALLAADDVFLRLVAEVSPEGLRGFLHIMGGMRDLSGRKFSGA
jgi:DNA-binding MarR family transcriptional regulator